MFGQKLLRLPLIQAQHLADLTLRKPASAIFLNRRILRQSLRAGLRRRAKCLGKRIGQCDGDFSHNLDGSPIGETLFKG